MIDAMVSRLGRTIQTPWPPQHARLTLRQPRSRGIDRLVHGPGRLVALFGAIAAIGMVLVGPAAAATVSCPTTPLADRLAAADGAFVGSLLSVREAPPLGGVSREALRYKVKVSVKGHLGATVDVTSQTGRFGLEQVYGTDAGILMSRTGGRWVSTICGQTSPAALLAEADEPKGAAIKVAIGIALLALVLLYAVRRMRRGIRPDLPGAPTP